MVASTTNVVQSSVLSRNVVSTPVAGQEPEDGKPEKHSSIFYMGIYAAISGAQLMVLQINFVCVVTFGIRAGRCAHDIHQ